MIGMRFLSTLPVPVPVPVPVLALLLALLAGCTLPDVGKLPERGKILADEKAAMSAEEGVPVSRVPVTAGMLVAKSIRQPLPREIGERRLSVSFPATESTLERLVLMVGYSGVRVAERFTGNSDKEFLGRSLPFRSFDGTLAELMGVLRSGIGVVSWWQDGTLFLTDQDRFALSVPQNSEVVQTIAKELEGLGAKEISSSLRGGQIVFSASPSQFSEVIQPYMDRIHRNMAMINIQLAVVDLALSDTTASGFDWNAFTAQITSAAASTSSSSTTTTTSTTSSASTSATLPSTTLSGAAGSIQAPLAAALSKGVKVWGLNGVLNVTGAINFLSKFGTANTRQNVELRTLSGTEVALRSGQTIPYVSGVGVSSIGNTGSAGSGNLLGSAQTSSVKTGLTIKLTPFFDSGNDIVTVDLNVLVNSVLEFRQLDAGSQVGTLTQPVTQEQSLNDIVRVLAGNTVIIGGLQIDNGTWSGTEPNFIRGEKSATDPYLPLIGNRSQDRRKEALFIIIRPSVTVFVEQAGG